jgi:hypothetical protein
MNIKKNKVVKMIVKSSYSSLALDLNMVPLESQQNPTF